MRKLIVAVFVALTLIIAFPVWSEDCMFEPGNWVRNPRFDQGLNCWNLDTRFGAAQFDANDSRLNLRWHTAEGRDGVRASQYLGFLFSGYIYGVSLIAWSEQPGTLVVSVRSVSDDSDSTGVALSLSTVSTGFGIGFGHLSSSDAELALHFERCTADVHVEYVEFTVMDGSAPVAPTTWGGIKALYRR